MFIVGQDLSQEIPPLIPLPPVVKKEIKMQIKIPRTPQSYNESSNQLKNLLKSNQGQSKIISLGVGSQIRSIPAPLTQEDVRKINKNIVIESRKLPLQKADKGIIDQEINRSKNLISQLVNKITVKTTANELLPISSEQIQKILNEIEFQKKDLLQKVENYESQLVKNPNNKNIRKQLQTIQKNIQRNQTMKLLYIDKLQLRNQIKRLNTIIEQMKIENKDIKSKIAQGIKQVQAHSHNLPCQREKIVSIQLKRTQEQLKNQRQMRIELQKNIDKTVQKFQRLYDQADIARKIVISQLKQIEMAKNKKQQINLKQQEILTHKKPSRILHQEEIYQDQTKKKHTYYNRQLQTDRSGHKLNRSVYEINTSRKYNESQYNEKSNKNIASKSPIRNRDMEQMVRKMHGNKNLFGKVQKKDTI